MGLLTPLIVFTPGTDILASEANSNNAAIEAAFNGFAVLTDVAKAITVQHTFNPAVASAPFLLGANAQNQLVTGLYAARAVLADTATALATPRNINGVAFDGTANITVPAAAGTLTGATLAAGVTASSLTSLGVLTALAVGGNAAIGGDLVVVGALSFGSASVPAASVQPGTFAAGNFAFQGTLTVGSGQLRAARVTQTGAGGAVSFASANHVRHTMTGNGTLTLSNGAAGGVYTVEVLQDGTGGRTVAWAAASGAVLWSAGAPPASTTTANRKDVYTFLFDGTNYLGGQFGPDYASTA